MPCFVLPNCLSTPYETARQHWEIALQPAPLTTGGGLGLEGEWMGFTMHAYILLL